MDFDGSSLTINFHTKPVTQPPKKHIEKSSENLTNTKYISVNTNRKRKVSNVVKNDVNSELYKKKTEVSRVNKEETNPRKYRPLINAIKEAEKITTKVSKKKEIKSNLENKLFDKNIHLDSFTEIDERLRTALKLYLKSNQLTVVQKLAWPTILKGENTLIKSPSGSGKTLAFLVPIINLLLKKDTKINRQDGVHALILVPTKELAKQITDILVQICRNFVWIVPGGLYGCDKRKAEKSRLRKGLNIVVATPGRLHDHLVHTKCLDLSRLEWFVVDEADLLLDMGYEQKFQEINNCIPKKVLDECQKIFLSATLSKRFISFFSKLFHENTYFVDASNEVVTLEDNIKNLENNLLEGNDNLDVLNSNEFDYPTNLKQLVIEIPSKLRLIALVWVLKYIISVKKEIRVIIFFSNIASAEFHCQLFQAINQQLNPSLLKNDINFKCLLLHGSMEIKERIHVYETFSKHNQCILFTTDVAARGLDFPCVDWIIQFNPAREIKEYVHRVGRTCRIGNNGNALLFLEPHEMSYMDLLYKSHLSIEQLNIHTLYQKISKNAKNLENDATSLFSTIREAVSAEDLYSLALKAYNSTIKAYTSYPRTLKQIFCLRNLHQGHLAESFAIREKPSDISKHLLSKDGNDLDEKKKITNIKPFVRSNYKVRIPPKTFVTQNSVRSASSLLLDEFQGGVVSGPMTKRSNKKLN